MNDKTAKDKRRTGLQSRYNTWLRDGEVEAINKLPNEFRPCESEYKYKPIYDGDNYSGLYSDD